MIGFPVPQEGWQLNTSMLAKLTRAILRVRGATSTHAVREWILQLATLAALDPKDIAPRLDAVIACQIRMGDIAQGTVRGEPFLLAAAALEISLPDGMIVLLGDHDEPTSASRTGDPVFPRIEGTSELTLIDWLELGGRELIRLPRSVAAVGCWSEPEPMPELLHDLISLCGEIDSARQSWLIPPESAAFLNELLHDAEAPGVKIDADSGSLDDDQAGLARAEPRARLVVEAGPGSGKTHTACARVAHLLDAGLGGSRILMLSFTRIAVAELRARLAALDAENAHTVEVSTFDSLAGRYRGGGSGGGHDATIRAATALLKSGDPVLLDEVRQLRQVMIDEAQDLVGPRREFCAALIAALHPKCGVTIFGDPAQAIFSFQDKAGKGETLFSALLGYAEFTAHRLGQDHRSQTPGQAHLVKAARPLLIDAVEDPKQAYFDVRSLINAQALQTGITNCETDPATGRGLVLVRSHDALLTLAENFRAVGRQFRLRLPGRPLRLAPWIGALLGGLSESETLDRPQLETLYAGLQSGPVPDIVACWDILADLDGKGRPTLRVGRIAEALLDPPLSLLRDYEGTRGPLLSTIHSVKGHEDDRVMLGLTKASAHDDQHWQEEARILYVGATRARRELRTFWISPRRYESDGSPERHWRPGRDHLALEVGLADDLVPWAEFRLGLGPATERAVIDAVWAVANGAAAEGRIDAAGSIHIHKRDSDGPALGRLSDGFVGAAIRLARRPETSPLPDRIAGFDIAGATTVVVPPRSGELPTLALQPLLGGFARIARE